MKGLPTPQPGFTARKTKILEQLSLPDSDYIDASPKGSVDEGIRDLIDEINTQEGIVTTSSCAGRVSVFVEGRKASAGHGDGPEAKPASSAGGKGGGGTWLFVSHDPLGEAASLTDGKLDALLGLTTHGNENERGPDEGVKEDVPRLIHFKFEPMILHILTASPEHAQVVLKCGLQAGFRESGAVSLLGRPAQSGVPEVATPMVAIRSMGLLFESVVGTVEGTGRTSRNVTSEYLRMLIRISNERFLENSKRIARFLEGLKAEVVAGQMVEAKEDGRSQRDLIREAKRAEGLRRQAEAKRLRVPVSEQEPESDPILQDTSLL